LLIGVSVLGAVPLVLLGSPLLLVAASTAYTAENVGSLIAAAGFLAAPLLFWLGCTIWAHRVMRRRPHGADAWLIAAAPLLLFGGLYGLFEAFRY
jgi:hypothetical protein